MTASARVHSSVTKKWARAALSHPAFCGVSRAHLGDLIEELADPWLARCESALDERRGGERRRAAGAGPKHDLVFTDRVLVTWSTCAPGFRTPRLPSCMARPAPRSPAPPARSARSWRRAASLSQTAPPRSAAAHAGGRVRLRRSRGDPAEDRGAETQLRRPKHARPDRDAHRGHCGAVPDPPGSGTEVAEGYRGLANEFPDQISARRFRAALVTRHLAVDALTEAVHKSWSRPRPVAVRRGGHRPTGARPSGVSSPRPRPRRPGRWWPGPAPCGRRRTCSGRCR